MEGAEFYFLVAAVFFHSLVYFLRECINVSNSINVLMYQITNNSAKKSK